MDYAAKAVQYALIAVLGSPLAAALISGDFSRNVLIGAAITAAGALAVYFKANTVTQPNAKKAIAVFTAVVLAVVSAWTDGLITASEWAAIAIAFVGAVQVGTVANVGDHFDVDVKGNATASR
jgi:hypothetical protein